MATPEEDTSASYDFDLAFQKKVVTLLLRDSTFARRAADLIRPEYFTEESLGFLAQIGTDFVKKYKSAPDTRVFVTLLKDEIAKKRLRDDAKDGIRDMAKEILRQKTDLSNSGYVLDKVAEFARHQAVEQAILKSVEFLEKGDFAAIQQRMRDALAVGNVSDGEEYDYWK